MSDRALKTCRTFCLADLKLFSRGLQISMFVMHSAVFQLRKQNISLSRKEILFFSFVHYLLISMSWHEATTRFIQFKMSLAFGGDKALVHYLDSLFTVSPQLHLEMELICLVSLDVPTKSLAAKCRQFVAFCLVCINMFKM